MEDLVELSDGFRNEKGFLSPPPPPFCWHQGLQHRALLPWASWKRT